MWIAAKRINVPGKYVVPDGMPLPHQQAKYAAQIKAIYGEDSVRNEPDVSMAAVKKLQVENAALRKRAEQLQKQLDALRHSKQAA